MPFSGKADPRIPPRGKQAISPPGDRQWRLDGQLPATVNWITIEVEPRGPLPLRVWIDGLGIR